MKKAFSILLVFSMLVVVLPSCGWRQLSTMKDCDFKFQKVTAVTWAGIDFMKIGTDYKNIDLATVAKFTKAIVNKDLALTVNLDVNAINRGSKQAELAGFDYILYYGGNKVGEGDSQNTKDISIAGHGGSMTIPVSFKLDCRGLVDLKKPAQAVEKVVNIVKDVSKVGKEDTDFSIKIRPHVRHGKKIINGTYITIHD